jgi:hypothetical protein
MQYKADKLKEIGCDIEYYTEKDKEAVMLWDSEICERIYRKLKSDVEFVNIFYSDNIFFGLSGNFCPFCNARKSKDCKDCKYGENHGVCGIDKLDDWWEIENYLFSLRLLLRDCGFTNRFYKTILDKAIKEAEK